MALPTRSCLHLFDFLDVVVADDDHGSTGGLRQEAGAVVDDPDSLLEVKATCGVCGGHLPDTLTHNAVGVDSYAPPQGSQCHLHSASSRQVRYRERPLATQ